MKKNNIWRILFIVFTIVFASCTNETDIEDFENCPNISFEIDHENGSLVYQFTAVLDSIQDVEFAWSIDGEVIDSGTITSIADQIIDYQFTEGTHKVCVKVVSDTCPLEFCEEIEVEGDDNDPCPDLFFTANEQDNPYSYKFIADFPGVENANFEWYVNGQFVESDNEDNYLYWQFEEGVHEVCIKTETPECPEGTEFCKEIVIEDENNDGDDCPDLFFSQDGDYLYADFEGINTLEWYGWYVNGELVEDEGAQNEGDNKFSLSNLEPGTYNICIKTETPECPEGTGFCKEIVIEDENNDGDDCPDLFFSQDGDYLYADFEGINTLGWYGWFVNGQLVEDEGAQNEGDNKFFLGNLEPGTYSICIMTETPECPEGTEFCKEIVIEDENNGGDDCPELFFAAEQDGNNPAYYFYPEYVEGANLTSFDWFIDGEYVGQMSDGANGFYYQFNPGTYEICMKLETPDCPNGTFFCKSLTVN